MVKPIAQEFGVEVEETLTGFKFIGEKIEKIKRKVKVLVWFEEKLKQLAMIMLE